MTPHPYGTPPALDDRLRYAISEPAAAYIAPAPSDAVDASELLRGRRESLDRVASGVTELIAERRRLSGVVLDGIDQDDLNLSNLMLRLYRPDQAPTDNPVYTKLKVERMRLGRERRMELVSCWRDTALLGKDLAELAARVEDAKRTSTFIGGEGS